MFLANETVVLKLRRHPIVFFLNILPFLILLAVPPIVSTMLSSREFLLPDIEELQAAVVLAVSLYYLFLILFMLYNFFDYFLDEWIITNRHIYDIQQLGLFNRTVAKESLDRIQDITMEMKGLLPTLFNYGEIYIQTAAEKERFVFHQIPDPQQVIEVTSKLLDLEKKIEEQVPTLVEIKN